MNRKPLSTLRIVFALFAIGFGLDKFFEMLPICSLTENLSPIGTSLLGVLEIIFGITLLLRKIQLLSLRILTGLMIGGMLMHLAKGSYDMSGAILGSIMGLFLILKLKKNNG